MSEPATATGGPEDTTWPVRLEGHMEPRLSRWLWLVKWILIIPHLIVLAVLWIVFLVLTLIAGIAILITGHYPRGLFDFNLGVLRWSWRVNFYSYGALGTDRYPPFTLGRVPDYPATFDVAYPARLSRGLVIVKWWLLAIPHYIVVAIFGGTPWMASLGWTGEDGSGGAVPFGGLIGVLVLFAAVVLLFRAYYPRGMFDLVMGLNRWTYRVIPYVALMRDEYPPFRLDQGPDDPGVPDRGSGGAAGQ